MIVLRCIVILMLFAECVAAQDLLNGLIVHYPMSGNAQDIGPNGFHGTVSGAVLGPDQDGNPNSAYYFDGINDFIDMPYDLLLKPQFTFTIACVVMYNTPQTITDTQIFTTDFEQNNYHGAWSNLVGGRVGISYGGGAGNTDAVARRTKLGTTVLNANQWYRLTFILRGPTDMEIYIDCLNDGGSYSGTGPVDILYTTIPGTIGRTDADMSGPASYFRGAMSDFRMWDRELTEFEINYMCNEVDLCNTTVTGDAVICSGSSALLSAQAQTFVGWAQADAPGQIISTQPQMTVMPTVSTVYFAYTACDTVPFMVDVVAVPVATFSLENPSGCPPLEVQFADLSGLGGDPTWQWDFGDGTTSNIQHPVHVYSASGVYQVTLTVTVSDGCSATATQEGAVVVTNAPTAAFAYTPPLGNVLEPEVQFIDQSHGADQWQWSFGNGLVSSAQHPQVDLDEPGVYLVELVVTNAEGCTDTAHGYYEVAPLFTLYVPNAFTPNGNRKNEVFYAYGEGITRFRMRIFNRWGMELFESKLLTTGWDGTYKGQIVPMGVYVWQIEASSDFGDEIERVGHVTVLR